MRVVADLPAHDPPFAGEQSGPRSGYPPRRPSATALRRRHTPNPRRRRPRLRIGGPHPPIRLPVGPHRRSCIAYICRLVRAIGVRVSLIYIISLVGVFSHRKVQK